jgi:hypothetical protein
MRATLDAAEIDVGNDIFECGQTYVALSRVKSLDGLYLSSFNVTRIKINRKVKDFYDKLVQEPVLEPVQEPVKEPVLVPVLEPKPVLEPFKETVKEIHLYERTQKPVTVTLLDGTVCYLKRRHL